MIEKELLEILACPEDGSALQIAEESLLKSLNEKISLGELKDRGGDDVSQALNSGLVREDQKYLYPIQNGIPLLLKERGILIES